MIEFRRPKIMGIINCTPDSFYPKSRRSGAEEGWRRARRMIADGADIIDVGGESTRPGYRSVAPAEQIARVEPVIREIRSGSAIPISIDTRSAEVAEAALDAGAGIINDISALRDDSRMAALAADRRVSVILMHMQTNPQYSDVVREVREFLERRIEFALAAGIEEEDLILDPGIGFGKGPGDNEALLANIGRLRIAEHPLLVGLSRKSFLGRILDAAATEGQSGQSTEAGGPENRLAATLGAHAWCLAGGADILRVHDVRETRDLTAVWERLSCAS